MASTPFVSNSAFAAGRHPVESVILRVRWPRPEKATTQREGVLCPSPCEGRVLPHPNELRSRSGCAMSAIPTESSILWSDTHS